MLSRRLIILIVLILLAIAAVAGAAWWWQQRTAEQQNQQQQLDAAAQRAAERLDFFTTEDRLVLFLSFGSDDVTLYGSNAVEKTVLSLEEAQPELYSNYVTSSQHWYAVTDQTVTQFGPTGSMVIGQLTQTVAAGNAVATQPALAVDRAEQQLAYVSRTDAIEEVRLVDLASWQETVLYQGEPTIHYANLTWSPDGSELAFTANGSKLITVTLDGVEAFIPVSWPFQEFNFVSWITRDQLAAVMSSTDTNPEPFQPKIVVFDRSGSMIEEHMVFEKIGVPRVLWSDDASQFLFYNPWQNTFFIYNRYDQLVQALTVAAPGKLVPFGYQAGSGPFALTPFTSDTTTPETTTTSTDVFEVTAEDWDRYNTAMRNIFRQWQIDFSSYRFATTDYGIEVAVNVQSDAKAPEELILIQTVLQAFAVLPEVPQLTVSVNDWKIENVSRAMVDDISQQVTGRTIENLFVINAQNPIGKRVVKTDNPDHHYIGDFVYSRTGDYNPYPTLALLGAVTSTHQFFAKAEYTVLYPSNLSVRTDEDRVTLFYTGETTFLSPTAWSEFGLTIKEYDAPGVTLEQWLSVNRSDQTAEEVNFTAREPLLAKHIVTNSPYTDEYVVLANDQAYVLTIQRDDGLTDEDQALLQAVTESFSVFYAIQRY